MAGSMSSQPLYPSRFWLNGLIRMVTIAGLGLCLVESGLPIASAQRHPNQPSQTIPTKLQTTLRQTMAQTMGGNLAQFRITQTQTATWQDCLSPQQMWPSATCQPIERNGWRVRVSGLGETWVYYITRAGSIHLDGPASLNPKVRATLTSTLKFDPAAVTITAAQPIQFWPDCQPRPLCLPNRTPAWKILVAGVQHPQIVSFSGQQLTAPSLSRFLPPNLAGMPKAYGEAVLQDVRDRHDGLLAPNLKVDQIRAITWHECRGGNPAPSQPIRGICPDISQSGWQLLVTSGPVRWVYYLLKPPISTPLSSTIVPVAPDGPQSLPQSVANAAIQAAAQRDRLPTTAYRIHWAEARFFDGCLNSSVVSSALHQPNGFNPALGCRQRIQSGWQVSVAGGKPVQTPWMGMPLSTYHTNLTGTDVRLMAQTTWLAPPSAPPASLK